MTAVSPTHLKHQFSIDWLDYHARYNADTIAALDVDSNRRFTYAEFNSRLKRLASCTGTTQRALLEKVLAKTEQQVLETLNGRQQDDYYDGKLTLRSNGEEEKSVQKD